jgi:hypothetical protein
MLLTATSVDQRTATTLVVATVDSGFAETVDLVVVLRGVRRQPDGEWRRQPRGQGHSADFKRLIHSGGR